MTFLQRLGFFVCGLCGVSSVVVACAFALQGLTLPAVIMGLIALLAFSWADRLVP